MLVWPHPRSLRFCLLFLKVSGDGLRSGLGVLHVSWISCFIVTKINVPILDTMRFKDATSSNANFIDKEREAESSGSKVYHLQILPSKRDQNSTLRFQHNPPTLYFADHVLDGRFRKVLFVRSATSIYTILNDLRWWFNGVLLSSDSIPARLSSVQQAQQPHSSCFFCFLTLSSLSMTSLKASHFLFRVSAFSSNIFIFPVTSESWSSLSLSFCSRLAHKASLACSPLAFSLRIYISAL